MLLLLIIVFSLLGSVGAIITASLFLMLHSSLQRRLSSYLLSYASGTLLAASLLGLLNNALSSAPPFSILSTLLAGIIVFFLLEKLLVWHHCHEAQCAVHGVAGPMLLIGDAVHNFVDGVVIAGGFLSSEITGIIVSLSVIVHEVPQELGDFAVLLHSGYPKKKALFLNILSSLSTIPGAILAYWALAHVSSAIPYIMALSAASFLYISLADLTPELHKKTGYMVILQQVLMMLAGIATILLILNIPQ